MDPPWGGAPLPEGVTNGGRTPHSSERDDEPGTALEPPSDQAAHVRRAVRRVARDGRARATGVAQRGARERGGGGAVRRGALEHVADGCANAAPERPAAQTNPRPVRVLHGAPLAHNEKREPLERKRVAKHHRKARDAAGVARGVHLEARFWADRLVWRVERERVGRVHAPEDVGDGVPVAPPPSRSLRLLLELAEANAILPPKSVPYCVC